jgi:hypothetical protein
MYDKKKNPLIIGSTKTDIKDLNVENITYLDSKQGYDIINCHYLIKEDGEIINCLDINLKCGHKSSEENDLIVIRYIGGLEKGKCVDTRTKNQKYSLYALLYTLHKMGFDEIIEEQSVMGVNTAGFDVIKETSGIEELWKWSDVSIETYRQLKFEMDSFTKIANDLIKSKKFKTKEEVLNSKYAKIYNLGIKKFNDIIDSHFNKFEELIEVGNEIGELNKNGITIHKKLYETLEEISKKYNFKLEIFLFTMIQENYCLWLYREEWFKYMKRKKYTHPICMFHAWSLIKKSYPVAKTVNVLNKYENYDKPLNEEELQELLLAYILLYEETKTITDFDSETMWEKLYEIMTRGDYVCGLNYVSGEHQINYRNVRLFLMKDWEAKLFKFY